MGTSKSSAGPGKNVGLVPPWLDAPATPPPQQPQPVVMTPGGANPSGDPPQQGNPVPAPSVPPVPSRIAIPRRFSEARRGLGDFVRNGDAAARKRGLGSYVHKGYRGAANTSARMGQAATSASRAYDVLSRISEGVATSADLGFDPAMLAGANIADVVDVLVDAICKNDTTLDDAGGRQAVSDALSEVLAGDPNLDPMALPPECIREVWLRTLSYDVFDTLMRDIGGGLQHAANGNFKLFNDRCIEIRDFVRESYRERLNVFEVQGQALTRANCDAIARDINRAVMDVFEGWV